jgi:signal transduction histidine kinase
MSGQCSDVRARGLIKTLAIQRASAASEDQRLSALFEIAKILALQHDLEDVVARFLCCLIATLEAADTGLFFLYDQASDRLTVCGAHGYDPDVLRDVRVAPGEAMSGRTLQAGQAALYSSAEEIVAMQADLSATNHELLRQAAAGLKEPHSAVCVPLVASHAKVGVLVLESRSGRARFTRADLPFLEDVAYLVALAIENARLRDRRPTTRALEEADRLKAELISTLAHEMRTPLTSIKGFSTALLMEEATFDPETQREFLQAIDEECDVLTGLIHDFLESSIIDAGLLRLELEPVRVPRLARDVANEVAHQTAKHRIVVDFPEGFPIVEADPGRIAQVLRNLLDNAVKYSPQGGIIVVRGQVQGAHVEVSVADQGVGIAPEHLNRLFEKFFRVESGPGRHVVGSGLGLPIALTIVEGHGGRIWAESKLGEGSIFTFTLPRERGAERGHG